MLVRFLCVKLRSALTGHFFLWPEDRAVSLLLPGDSSGILEDKVDFIFGSSSDYFLPIELQNVSRKTTAVFGATVSRHTGGRK